MRGYISCVLGCPYEGYIQPSQVVSVTKMLLDLGVHEISLGDTIGVGTPRQTQLLLDAILPILPITQLAMHFHDTYGQAVANIYAPLSMELTALTALLQVLEVVHMLEVPAAMLQQKMYFI